MRCILEVRFFLSSSFLFFLFVDVVNKKRAELEIVPFYVFKKWVIIMIETIIKILFILGMIGFCVVVMILNNIDEFIEWLEKKINKR